MIFVGFKKASGSINSEHLFLFSENSDKYGAQVLADTYKISEMFQIKTGLMEKDRLPPLLFN